MPEKDNLLFLLKTKTEISPCGHKNKDRVYTKTTHRLSTNVSAEAQWHTTPQRKTSLVTIKKRFLRVCVHLLFFKSINNTTGVDQ